MKKIINFYNLNNYPSVKHQSGENILSILVFDSWGDRALNHKLYVSFNICFC